MSKYRMTRFLIVKNIEYYIDINVATKNERQTLSLPIKLAI
jgi:hypothetical protein